MKLSAFLSAPALGAIAFFCGGGAFATVISNPTPTISSFTVTRGTGNGFSGVINSNFDSSSARITNTTITCLSEINCSGSLASFELLGSGLTSVTPFSIAIDGTSTAALTGTVVVGFRGLTSTSYAFNVASGAFTTAITPTGSVLPAIPGGNFDIVGSLNLVMPSGSTIILPSSFQMALGGATPSQVPEPASAVFLVAGVGALALIKRYSRL